MWKIKDIQKEMLDYLLQRSYFIEELDKISKNYKEEDCYKRTDEKVDEVFNLCEKKIWFNDERWSANREIGYYRGYRDAIEQIKKKF